MARIFSQPYISPPDYDTVEFPFKKKIIREQQSAFNEYERCQQSNAAARQEVPPQLVDAGVFCRPDQCSRSRYVDDNSC
jgi:hypothetical protein